MLIFGFLLFSPIVFCYPSTIGSSYANSQELISGMYMLYWNTNSTSIVAEVHVLTSGWLAFGISPSGGMSGADAMVAWIDSTGTTQFTDRYLTSSRTAVVDSTQNWFLMGSKQTNGYTCIQFTRLINTCDTSGDMVIPTGNTKVIVAYSSTLPASGGDISYHGATNRKTISVQLLSSLTSPQVISAADNAVNYTFSTSVVFSFIFYRNYEYYLKQVSVPTTITYYHCTMFKLPTAVISTKTHILRVIH
jgi:hypothetical protein